MKANRLVLHSTLTLALGLCVSTQSSASTVLFSAWDNSPCDVTARAALKAARDDANAEYWLAFAACINHPNDLPDCLREAWQAREEALDLAHDQYEARLDVCDLLGGAAYDPDLDEEDFSANVTNPYFRLIVGRTLVYEKPTDKGLERVTITTLPGSVDIDDIPCRSVRDTVTLAGDVVEDTIDWFSQHDDGTVWYVGEIAQNFEDGLLDNLDGSWRAGKDGAEPGRQMLATPTVGAAYRQEFLVNEAEDIARVLSLHETVTVPAGTFTNCVRIEEWSPLSPDGGVEWKYYAPNIGLVLELDPATGERLELVQIIN